MRKTIATIGTLFGSAAFVMSAGCSLQTSPDASRFREPIPQASQVALGIAGSQVAGAKTQAAPAGGVHLQDGPGSGGGGGTTTDASYYQFTRSITDSVDTVTTEILGEILVVSSLPPTTVDANHAVWGPGSSDALDPVTWKLTVTATGGGAYTYEVDGRPHLSTSESDWKAVLTGQGYDGSSPSYQSGSFTVDNGALAALDPTSTTSTGTVSITYDARSYPLNAAADVNPNDGTGQYYDVTVLHGVDGSGVMSLTALADVSTPPDGKNENVAENSRWDSTGAGRADVKMTGGDFGATTVMLSQCWSSAFAQTYYTDSVDYQPTTGQPSSCVFGQASFANAYQRWKAGWPSFTATKVPRQVAVTFPPASIVASTVARSAWDSTTRARIVSSAFMGVGRFSFTSNSEVTVQGGTAAPAFFIRCQAAVQFEWQSRRAPQMPPLSTPGNARWCASGVHRATVESSLSAKLRMRRPWAFFGPQPKHSFSQAYVS